MTREEIIAAIQECASRLGHVPSHAELQATLKLSKFEIRKKFGNYRKTLEACGLERFGAGYEANLRTLFLEWAAMVRRLGRVPTIADYEFSSRYSCRPLMRRFRGWNYVPAGMLEYARKERLEGEWNDVVEIVARHLDLAPQPQRTSGWPYGLPSRPRVLMDRPVYGPPMVHSPLTYAPTNEAGVLFLFGAVARQLGFAVIRVQAGFPDCEAMREVEPGRWQWVRIEIEYESRNFMLHGHSAAGCDLIVCWNHNWPDCPMEVIELSRLIGTEQKIG